MKRRTKIPPKGASEQEINGFFDEYFDEHSVYRSRTMERLARNGWYYLGRQWIEPYASILVDSVRGYSFRDLTSTDGGAEMPRPVTNYIGFTVDAEVTSHWKRELVPNPITDSADPATQVAAQQAKDILLDRIRVLDWRAIRYQADFDTALYGTGILKSYWDESWVDLTTIGVLTAVGCQACGATLASPEVPRAFNDRINEGALNTAEETEEESPEFGQMLNLKVCPACGTVELAPKKISGEEAENSVDLFGRPLGTKVAKGNTAIENVTPFDFFPENGGIGVSSKNMRQFGQRTVRSIDWVLERIPELADEDWLQPEEPRELMSTHPTLGDYSMLGFYDRNYDSATYSNHVAVFEFYSLPTVWDPEGRAIWRICDHVALDEDLLATVDAPDGKSQMKVSRVKYAVSIHKHRPGEFFGSGLADDLISPQNRLNCIDSQVIDTRERLGSPHIVARRNANLEGPAFLPGMGSSKVLFVDKDPFDQSSGLGIEFFGDKLFDTQVFMERDRCIADMQKIGLPTEIERGEAPGGVPTTSGLMALGEQAERKRAMRDMEINNRDSIVWSHALSLLSTLRIEADDYEVEQPDNTWAKKQFDRESLKGLTKVKMEAQAYVNESLYVKEGMREAQADNLVFADSPSARVKLLRYRNLPTDVNEDSCREVDLAKRQWISFVQDGKLPVIDPTLDDPATRWQELGVLVKGEDGIRIGREAGWDRTVTLIWGWEDRLAELEAAQQRVMEFYGSKVPPEAADEAYAEAKAQHTASLAEYDEKKRAYEEAPLAPGMPRQKMPVPPPEEPPHPAYLPEPLNERILLVWNQLLAQAGQEGQVLQRAGDQYMRMRAVVEAYRMMAERKAALDAAPPPPVPGKGLMSSPPAGQGQPLGGGPSAVV